MKKKSVFVRKPVSLTLVAVALLLAIGITMWYASRSDEGEPGSAEKVVHTVDPMLLTIEQTIPQRFPEYVARKTGWNGQRNTGNPVTVEGYKFTLSSLGDPGLLIHPRPANDELITPSQPTSDVIAYVQEQLAANSFTRSTQGSKTAFQQDYTRSGETCMLKTGMESKMFELRCRSNAIDQAFAAQARPFVKTYLKAHKNVRESEVIYGPMVVRSQNPGEPITASKVAGYDLAEAVVQHSGDSSIALFYSKQGRWHYITEATDEYGFSCSEIMRDPDARTAFRGQWCYQRENDEGLRILDFDPKTDCQSDRIACTDDGQQQR